MTPLHLSLTAVPPTGAPTSPAQALADEKTSGPIVRSCRVPTPTRAHFGLGQSTACHQEKRKLKFCSRVSAFQGAGPHEVTREPSGASPLKEADQRANTGSEQGIPGCDTAPWPSLGERAVRSGQPAQDPPTGPGSVY